MKTLIIIAQIIVALSVYYVWIFRYHNVVKEFQEFGLSVTVRNMVGAFKISLAALLIAAIWFHDLVFYAAFLMGLMMVSAQYFHFKCKSPTIKRVPSFLLLILCLFIAINSI
jgi:small-conductance mechanosensitive channel